MSIMTQLQKTSIEGALIISPQIYEDDRGYFFESWNSDVFKRLTNSSDDFVQDNHSFSKKGVLRGLHYQLSKPQGKLVRVIDGVILDVAVDLRLNSPSFGKHVAVKLDGLEHKQFWVPPGCAHGFFVVSESAHLLYKVTAPYEPQDEHTIRWNDSSLSIDWRLNEMQPILSQKDRQGVSFADAPKFLRRHV